MEKEKTKKREYRYYEFPRATFTYDLQQYELRDEDKIFRIDKNGKMRGIKGVSRKPRWKNWAGYYYVTWTIYLTEEGEKRMEDIVGYDISPYKIKREN